MILHLVPDEKFIDFAYDEFEKIVPGENRFLAISDQIGETFKYIKSEQIGKISTEEANTKRFMDSLNEYECVVLHMFSMHERVKIRIVLEAQPGTKFVWLGWGGDFYHYISGSHESLFLKKTRKLWKQKNQKTRFKNLIKSLLGHKKNHLRAIERVRYFAPVIPTEYDLLKSVLPQLKAEFAPFSYSNLDDMLRGLEHHKIESQNILIGNSASYENNHLEVFDLLEKLDIGKRKIIVPLSYGIPDYRDLVRRQGEQMFEEHFFPLIDFMPKDKYHETIASCSIVIMNHLRQQAMGNIITMMYLGAKIFLNPKNPTFDFFKNEGAYVFSIEALSSNLSGGFDLLSVEQIVENRKILEKHWSAKAVEEKTRKLIAIVRGGQV